MTLGVNFTRAGKLEELWAQIKQNKADLIAKGEADMSHEYFVENGLHDQLEEIYLDELGKFRDHQLSFRNSEKPPLVHGSMDRTPSVSVIEQHPTIARLAPIEIEKFSGDPNDWVRFRDIFQATVVDVTHYTDANKLWYLLNHVTGDASTLIMGIPLEVRNFTMAWNTLKNNYDLKRRLVDYHLKALFSLNAVKEESANDLRVLLAGTRNAIIALKSLNRPVENWDDFLVYLTIHKTDKETIRQ